MQWYEILTKSQIEQVHEATLKILEQIYDHKLYLQFF